MSLLCCCIRAWFARGRDACDGLLFSARHLPGITDVGVYPPLFVVSYTRRRGACCRLHYSTTTSTYSPRHLLGLNNVGVPSIIAASCKRGKGACDRPQDYNNRQWALFPRVNITGVEAIHAPHARSILHNWQRCVQQIAVQQWPLRVAMRLLD